MRAFPDLGTDQGPLPRGRWQRVGIVGGVGPLASALFYADLVAETPASGDGGHLPLVLVSEPDIPSRRECLLRGGPSPGPALRGLVERLAVAGASVVAVPSSTCHAFYSEFSDVAAVRCINLLVEVAAFVAEAGWEKVAVLGTEASVRADVYRVPLEERGVECAYPDSLDQERIDGLIDTVKGGGDIEVAVGGLGQLLEGASEGCEGVVIACTELSVLCRRASFETPLADASKVLAAATVRAARQDATGSG